MNSDIFTKPIGRLHYFLGNVLIGLVTVGTMHLILGDGYRKAMIYNEKMVEVLPLLLLFSAAKIVIAYKRLRDITINPKAVYWLALPVLGVLLNLTAPLTRGFGSVGMFNILSPHAILFGLPIAIIGVANLIFSLVLLFKKGGKVQTSSIIK